MKKKILKFICAVSLFVVLTGCGATDNTSPKMKANCHATECIKKIDDDSTVEDINKVIGFEGELIDDKNNTYYWKISEEESIKVTYYNRSKGTIYAEFNRDTLANQNVDFSRYDELQVKIKEGITYDDFKTYIGNVEGIVTEKSGITTKYTWVSTDGSYLTASFSNNSKKCTFASGRIK